MGSAGFLVLFAIVNAANFKKSQEIKSNKFIASLGVLSCVFALGTLVWHTFQTSPSQLWVLVAMAGIAATIEGGYIWLWRKPQKEGRIHDQSTALARAASNR